MVRWVDVKLQTEIHSSSIRFIGCQVPNRESYAFMILELHNFFLTMASDEASSLLPAVRKLTEPSTRKQ